MTHINVQSSFITTVVLQVENKGRYIVTLNFTVCLFNIKFNKSSPTVPNPTSKCKKQAFNLFYLQFTLLGVIV